MNILKQVEYRVDLSVISLLGMSVPICRLLNFRFQIFQI